MEREKKRKRADHGHSNGGGGGGGGERARKEENEVPQPTEEEVEEFFSILRRMSVAVKYFKKSGSDGSVNVDGHKTAALEGPEVDGVTIGGGSKTGVGGTGLDLNEVPEAEM